MKIVPSEFSNSAWEYFIFAKEIAFENHQQDVDSDNLLLALVKKDDLTKKIFKKNNVNIKGKNGKVPPTPPIIPSTISDLNHGLELDNISLTGAEI